MNSDNLKIVIDITSSLAIIISLIYLSVQVKQGTKNLNTTIRDSAFNSLMEWNYHVMSDTELAWVFINGCRDFDSLSETQKPRFLLVMYSYFKAFESIYVHTLDHSVDNSVWQNNSKIFIAYFSTPGAQFYWKERKLMFHPKFVSFLEQAKDPEMQYGHVIIEKNKAESNGNKR